MSKIPVFFIIIIGLIIVTASFRFLHQRRQEAENDRAPLLSQAATVIETREAPAQGSRSRQQQVVPAGASMRYSAAFRLTDGRELQFRVSRPQFQQLKEGATGTLFWRGTRYETFRP
ncbi:DUF2500 domain-containing protein [Erwinia sp. HR93]|uniref:DUF2500 domain-containing protein n=1 Tax=Erwinia sp. HR93 TaxID=3094840 RepID=UPI002ADEAB8C|nr:DUF2500 domain-containing protein [Erwinia sp. HR93]MEA1063053.1 DUF2500 domain-containing protein [Erwinia sp. HR93]